MKNVNLAKTEITEKYRVFFEFISKVLFCLNKIIYNLIESSLSAA